MASKHARRWATRVPLVALVIAASMTSPAVAEPRTSTDSVVSWGSRGEGGLGNRTTLRRTTPVQVCAPGTTNCEAAGLGDAISVSGGYEHSLALLSDGTVMAWGENSRGQLGDGTKTSRTSPVQVCAVGATDCAANPLRGVVAIAAGNNHNVALLNDGTVVSWGLAGAHLGNGSGSDDRTTPARVCAVGTWDCANQPLSGITAISAGSYHNLALRADGSVVAWGSNSWGQLGDHTSNSKERPVAVCAVGATDCTANPLTGVSALAAGDSHSLAVLAGGGAIAWGSNQLGQVGDNSSSSRNVPVRVCAVGATDCTAQPLTGIAAVEAGGSVSAALRTDGTVVGWGVNFRGQLGDGTTTNRSTPVATCAAGATDCANQPLGGIASIAVSGGHTLAVSTGGSALAWGFNGYGQLGDGTTADRTTPVPTSTGVRAVGTGARHSLAVRSDGTVAAWGDYEKGQIGDGAIHGQVRPGLVCAPASTDCANDRLNDVIALSANGLYYGGGGHSLALRSDGSVLSWGGNGLGQLGDGTTMYRDLPVPVCAVAATDCSAEPLTGAVAIATGANHSLALLSDGTVVAWGRNGVGNLGNGTWWDRSTPTQVCAVGSPDCATKLTGVVAIAAGGDHSLALLSDGTVVGWGSNYSGELGDGTGGTVIQARNIPVRTCAVGAADCAPLTGVTSIRAGNGFSFALLAGGGVVAWGGNYSGQLGDGTTSGRLKPVRVCAVDATDCTANPLTSTAIEAAGNHSAALLSDGTVAAWGENTNGQLGDATTTNRSTPVQVCAVGATDCTANPLTAVTGLALGYSHTTVLVTGGKALSWGSNYFGQLGDGTTTGRVTPGWVCAPGQTDCAANPLTGVSVLASGYNHNLAIVTPPR